MGTSVCSSDGPPNPNFGKFVDGLPDGSLFSYLPVIRFTLWRVRIANFLFTRGQSHI
jgi:hypothetical protein